MKMIRIQYTGNAKNSDIEKSIDSTEIYMLEVIAILSVVYCFATPLYPFPEIACIA